ncbi:hypothetical protein Poli38472_007434 [Pythium oligandrum]|uniref:Coiled-coil domain-containing protein 22 homolog n=1 Tax=Pythium oligandrum TaxID=41045 RepID=A0A8K1CQ58_PYTOL|nr:hypothetical protein Poli38472_007434 [Pythium oligandrum]|eukprot:TMW67762.1 hypothetical protein Poli38472_007434 [Pythium oligandrum]
MAETDRFVFQTLAETQCLASEAAQTMEMRDVTSQVLVTVVWHCLARVQSVETHLDLALPTAFDAPVGVAARHRVGSQLANTLKELGYAGDCGYNHFLYPTEKETRSMLSWLVSKLPRNEKTSESTRTTTASWEHSNELRLDRESVADVFSQWMRQRTLYVTPQREIKTLKGFQSLPPQTAPLHLPWRGEHSQGSGYLFDGMPSGTSKAVSVLESLAVTQQLSSINIAAFDLDDADEDVVVERIEPFNATIRSTSEDRHLGPDAFRIHGTNDLPDIEPFGTVNTTSSDSAAVDTTVHKSTTDTELSTTRTEDDRQAMVERMNARLAEIAKNTERMSQEMLDDQSIIMDIQKQIEQAKGEGQKLKQELTMNKQILSLLPHAAENIAKLEGLCAKNEAKLAELAAEWEKHQAPLLEEEKVLASTKANYKARGRQLIAEMKLFRAEIKEMKDTIQVKMDTLQSLDKTFAALPRDLNRNSYTNRIMDIIKQVHKQKDEINKIIDDIKSIQKQLNFSSEKLKRTEAVTEEKIFTAAEKHVNSTSGKDSTDNAYVECYRKFAQVRELFEELILVIGDVGKKENSARDLENWITQLQGRDSSAHLERVLADLQSVRLENAALSEQLRALR